MYTYEQKELRNEKINSTVNYFIPCLSNHSISSPKCLYIFWLYRKMQRGHFAGCVVAGLLLVARANIYIQPWIISWSKENVNICIHFYIYIYLYLITIWNVSTYFFHASVYSSVMYCLIIIYRHYDKIV